MLFPTKVITCVLSLVASFYILKSYSSLGEIEVPVLDFGWEPTKEDLETYSPWLKQRDHIFWDSLTVNCRIKSSNESSHEPTVVSEPRKGCPWPWGVAATKTRRQGFTRRSAIRNIMNHLGVDFHIFMLGLPSEGEDPKITEMINNEISEYDDIVVGNFLDDYVHIRAKEWFKLWYFARRCYGAYLWSFDDDVIPNWSEMVESTGVVCHHSLLHTSKPYRHRITPYRRWYISPQEYSLDKYPPYCDGKAYSVTRKAAEDMIKEAEKRELRWEEGTCGDMFTTGLFRVLSHTPISYKSAVQWLGHSEIDIGLREFEKAVAMTAADEKDEEMFCGTEEQKDWLNKGRVEVKRIKASYGS